MLTMVILGNESLPKNYRQAEARPMNTEVRRFPPSHFSGNLAITTIMALYDGAMASEGSQPMNDRRTRRRGRVQMGAISTV